MAITFESGGKTTSIYVALSGTSISEIIANAGSELAKQVIE